MLEELETFVKVRKDEYEELKNKIDFMAGRTDTLKDTQEQQLYIISKLQDKLDKIKEILKYEYSDAVLGRFGRDLKYGLLEIIERE